MGHGEVLAYFPQSDTASLSVTDIAHLPAHVLIGKYHEVGMLEIPPTLTWNDDLGGGEFVPLRHEFGLVSSFSHTASGNGYYHDLTGRWFAPGL